MKPSPSLRAAPVRRGRVMTKDKPGLLIRCFSSPVVAFNVTFALLFLTLVAYILIHVVRRSPEFCAQDFVTVEEDATFRLNFNDANLGRFFSKTKIAELRDQLEDKRKYQSQVALQQRRSVLVPAMEAVQARLWSPAPPGLLGKSISAATDDDFLFARLPVLRQWLTNNYPAIEPGKQTLLRVAADQMADLDENENRARVKLADEMMALEPVLSFGWLYSDGAWWAVEVVAWSFIGVLANTIIGLISACRARNYRPGEYLLLLPKMFLAPVLAFVVVSFWATGMSESQISFLNLPYFLVTSFLLGFVTESVYDRLRKLGDLIVPAMASADTAKLDAAAANVPYKYVNAPPSAVAPKDLVELEASLKAAAKAAMERGLVARLSEPTV